MTTSKSILHKSCYLLNNVICEQVSQPSPGSLIRPFHTKFLGSLPSAQHVYRIKALECIRLPIRVYTAEVTFVADQQPLSSYHWNLGKGNSLNLDGNTLGKFLDGNTAASRLVRKVLFVHAVHFRKVLHVGQEDGGLFLFSLAIGFGIHS